MDLGLGEIEVGELTRTAAKAVALLTAALATIDVAAAAMTICL